MKENNTLTLLRNKVETLYNQHNKEMLFHGWHHVSFVAKKAREFAESLQANVFLTESAALVHDLNYLVKVDTGPGYGAEMRSKMLSECGYSQQEIENIESIVLEENTATRSAKISLEGMALSDADTLFKALPITPILFTGKYIQENKVDVEKLSKKITEEQKPLFDQSIYFYTDQAKERYLHWAKVNFSLWENVQESLKDADVQELLAMSRERGVL